MAEKLSAGARAYAGAVVNVRRSPGYTGKPAADVLGQIPFRCALTLVGDPMSTDGLTWWPVRVALPDGRTLEGWAAQNAPGGATLLLGTEPARPRVKAHRRRGPSTFELDEEVANLAHLAVAVRQTPGYRNKAEGDVVGRLAPKGAGIISGASRKADGLAWQRLVTLEGDTPVEGWAAVGSAGGDRALVPAAYQDMLDFSRPFAGVWPLTQGWGSNADFYRQFTYDGEPLRGHNGFDFGMPVGTPLLAVDDAMVLRADFDPGGFGNFVLLDHIWGESLYAHLDRIDVRVGQLVSEGEQVGLSGNTGASTGPHVHFSIRIHPYDRKDGWGGFCNPAPFVRLSLPETPFHGEMAPSPLSPELPGSPRP